jgi:hypothetical protein
MAVADGGGVGKELSDGVVDGDGLFGGVIGKRLVDSEGEIGGEHLVLHPGQFLFEDSHWKSGEQPGVRRDPDVEANVHPSNGQSKNTVHNRALFLDFWRVRNCTGVSGGAIKKTYIADTYQIPQSVSGPTFWNLVIPFDLLPDHEFDLQLLRLAGTFVFTAKPESAHWSTGTAEGGVSDGFKMELGVSAPRFI